MSEKINAVKGTEDLYGKKSALWKNIEDTLVNIAFNYGFSEIRTPVFESTSLFARGVGQTSDVVQKEMYTFDDKGGRSITLRPEGTAGVVRSFIERGLSSTLSPQKLCYLTSCYRYENTQKGRLREFHQFGAEVFSTSSSLADAELIIMASEMLKNVGITDVSLNINSIGCKECRAKYKEALIAHFDNKHICANCTNRLNINPLRVLDCKEDICKEARKNAPIILDYLCDDCKSHFSSLKSILDSQNIAYKVDPTIVRGLDYYNKTVFEFISDKLGAQSTVCGGGRYDSLVEELGGAKTSALGFAIGLERLYLILEAQNSLKQIENNPQIFIAYTDIDKINTVFKLCKELRSKNIFAICDTCEKSLNAQLKYANKINAKNLIVIGDNEIKTKTCNLKNMQTGEMTEYKLDSLANDITF